MPAVTRHRDYRLSFWLPKHAELLRTLRIEQGIDAYVLAHSCALSSRQLQELEEGGLSSFYSEAIKYHTGMKVLRKLGIEAPEGSCSHPGAGLQDDT